MSSEWDANFFECYHNPREWDKTLAENIWETFLFGQFWVTLHTLRLHHSDLVVGAALRLAISVYEEEKLPLIWLLSATLLSIWEQRELNLKVKPYLVRAQLEANVNPLRETRHENWIIKFNLCLNILNLNNFFLWK